MSSESEPKSLVTPQTPLFFMHIPKTGGMSLFTAFAALWKTGIADLYDMTPARPAGALQQLERPDVSLVCGHYSFGLHQWAGRPAYYASVVREPIARIHSLYEYCQPMFKTNARLLRDAGGDMNRLRSNASLSDFYFDFEPCLRGDTSPEAFFAGTSPELDNAMVRRFSGWGLHADTCPASMLEQAKDHIERYFSVVGVLERYDETLALLSSTFGLPSLARNHVNRRPANRSGNPVPPHFAQQVRDRNPLDCALYEWIVKRFDGHMRLAKPILLPATTQPPSTPIPLWRAVGRSPLREAAMKQGGVPTRKPVPSGQIVALNGLRVRRNEQLIISDLTLRLSPATDKAATPRHQPLTLSMDADFARKMIDALQQAVDAAAQGPGIPKP